jgi:hypothetical protein
LDLLDAVGVGVFAARLRPVLIDAAGVVRLQKRAGELPKHPIAVFVKAQVAGLKVRCFEPKALGHTVFVAFGPQRAGRFAAVRAVKAIGAGKNGVVKLVHHGIKVPRRLPFESF